MTSQQKAGSWHPISTAPLDVEVETKIDDQHGERNVQTLVGRRRNANSCVMWFVPDGSMYVYYEPTHWRYKEQTNGQ